MRGPLAWPPVPAIATRAQTFDDLVMDAAERLQPHWAAVYPTLEFAVEDVPAAAPAPWEANIVPLGRAFGPDTNHAPRVIIYRRPVETRVTTRRDLAELVADIVTEQVAALLGRPPEDIDPGYAG